MPCGLRGLNDQQQQQQEFITVDEIALLSLRNNIKITTLLWKIKWTT